MAERDKVIKSGQLTLPRLLFLVVVGGLIVFTVYKGGVFLSIGYWLLTLSICGLLILIAIDYGVSMDKIALTSGQTPETAGNISESAATEIRTTMGDAARAPKAKRRASRPSKRRR
jgi:hypothetical protein